MVDNNTTSILIGNKLEHLTFGWTDYSLFVFLLGISMVIGVYFGFFKKQDSTTEYLLGGKTMSFFPISMSLIASHISGVSLLGVPSEVYQHGSQYAACIFTSLITCSIIAYIYLPVFFKLQLTSIFEYLEIRFARPGGLKAVVWADTIQMTITVGSLFAVLVLGIRSVGGIAEIWKIADEGGRVIFWNMNPSPFTRNSFWGMSLGMSATWLVGLGISQVSMQRFLAVPTMTEARKSIAFMAVGQVIVKWISVFTGLIMYAKYYKCDPITAHVVTRSDQILPYYVLDVAADAPGLPGLFLAGLVSAGLATMSGGLNTAAGTIYEDFIEPWMPDIPDKEKKAATIMKITVVIVGTICVALVFVVDRLGDIFQVSMSLTGITAGSMLGLFSLGMLVPWATTKGAVIGSSFSMALMVWIIVGAQWNMALKKLIYKPLPTSTAECFLKNDTLNNHTTTMPTNVPIVDVEEEPFILYTISFMYYTLIGCLVTIVIGTIVSFLCGAPDLNEVNKDHFPPIIQRFLPRKKYTEVSLHSVPTSLMTEKSELMS
ncbi:hypothetical protein M0802_005481 [Mischocyttarus mexicanus]|nr:hypothetical protein M0802_005481 [Mischocyttarus mexicanus]